MYQKKVVIEMCLWLVIYDFLFIENYDLLEYNYWSLSLEI